MFDLCLREEKNYSKNGSQYSFLLLLDKFIYEGKKPLKTSYRIESL